MNMEIKEQSLINTKVWDSIKQFDLDYFIKNFKTIEWSKFFKEEHPKNQIVLHHTVSGIGIDGDLHTWEQYKANIATPYLIERDGTINELFDPKYWAYHLGCGKPILDKQSIGIELDNWGQLKEKDGLLYTIYGNKVDVPIMRYEKGFRGEQIFEAYTEKQLISLSKVLLYLNKRFNIPLNYNGDMWDISQNALNGNKGIYAHVSYRPFPSSENKWDVHPDINLIAMLKSLPK